MNIAMLLTNGFDPDPRVYKEAKSLVKLGHKVEILCWDRSGKYIDKPEEMLDGIKIVRFFGNAVYGSGYKQIGKFLDFKKSVFEYMKNKKFQALHCHDFDGLFIGNALNKKLKLKLTYDEHDLFYLYFADRGGFINKSIASFIILKEKLMFKNVDTHIVVTPKMKQLYEGKAKKIVVVNNSPYRDCFKDIEKTKSGKLRVGFIGSIRYYDEMVALVNAAQKFKENVQVIISGRGICLDKLKEYCANMDNVELTGGYSMDQLESLYKNTDVTFAYYPGSAGAISMPNKFYESIITETPIIANAKTEFGEEVEKNGFGYSLLGKNLEKELEEVLNKLVNGKNEKENIVNNMRRQKENYFWEANEQTLEDIYK